MFKANIKKREHIWIISDQNDIFILQRNCITKRSFSDTIFTLWSPASHPENPWRLFENHIFFGIEAQCKVIKKSQNFKFALLQLFCYFPGKHYRSPILKLQKSENLTNLCARCYYSFQIIYIQLPFQILSIYESFSN